MLLGSYARHPARGKVSGGGPPPHFNKPGDNLQCNGQVDTNETTYDFPSPELAIHVPVAAHRLAHGSATIPYDANGQGVQIDLLGLAPNKASDVTWDLSGGSTHHFVIETRSWIPLERIADPLFASPVQYIDSITLPRSRLSPNCLVPPDDEQQYTEVSSTYRGDAHAHFDGTYRLANRVEFDYDGESITNFRPTPNFPHVGETHEDKRYTVIGMAEPHPAKECTRSGTAPDGSGQTASGRTFQVSYRGANPLLVGAPDIVQVLDGVIRANGIIAVKYTVTNFPSSGLRVTRDGSNIAEVLTNDVSCLTPSDVQGYRGLARLSYGLGSTRSGSFEIDYRHPLQQTIKSALCSGQ